MSEPTPRELVCRTLRHEPVPRVPRHLWTLSWAERRYPDEIAAIRQDFPEDIMIPRVDLPRLPWMRGTACELGTYVDEWGCAFNVQEGVVGEVKEPLVESYPADLDKVRPPREWLDFDDGQVNRQCADSERFMLGDTGYVRLFERMQFLRGTVNLFMDIAERSAGLLELRDRIHEWNLTVLDRWLRTDIDGMGFMDDWGSQRSLLIHPDAWRELFKPCYREYIERIHRAGKFAFMHSDGHIFDIYEDLIEIGLDAVNSQLFCMDVEEIGRRFKGRLTFWGEIDRQHVLCSGSVEDVRRAVHRVADALYDGRGGVIAQCEFGAGAQPANVRAVYEEWMWVGQEMADRDV